MPIALSFFLKYAYLILFLWVLVEQFGVPIPSVPLLLTAGTLTAAESAAGADFCDPGKPGERQPLVFHG